MSGKRPLLVMKFGGTSVGDAARFRQCAEIVQQAAVSHQVIVGVSAGAGVTDRSFRTIDCARHGHSAAAASKLRRLESIHREPVKHVFYCTPHRLADAESFLNEIFSRLESAVQALLALRSGISAETADSLVALGERISAWTLATYLDHGEPGSVFVKAEDVIVTDQNFGNAA